MRRLPSLRTVVTLLAILAAFGLGMLVTAPGERDEPSRMHTVTEADSGRRDIYSPNIVSDPRFQAEQRRNVEALEEHCRTIGELCAEARGARVALEKLR